MNWNAIGAVGEVVGALAVIATLAYLARQVKQTRIQIRDQLEQGLRNTGFEAYAPIYEGEHARIFHTGLISPGELEAHEAYVFDLLMWRHFSTVLRLKSLYDEGHLTDVDRATYVRHYRHRIFGYPGARTWVEANTAGTPAEEVFAELVAGESH